MLEQLEKIANFKYTTIPFVINFFTHEDESKG